MTKYEVLMMNKELLKRLHDLGIKTGDYIYADIYTEYKDLREQGFKTDYIVGYLSERYKVCERKVWRAVKEMREDCRKVAV